MEMNTGSGGGRSPRPAAGPSRVGRPTRDPQVPGMRETGEPSGHAGAEVLGG